MCASRKNLPKNKFIATHPKNIAISTLKGTHTLKGTYGEDLAGELDNSTNNRLEITTQTPPSTSSPPILKKGRKLTPIGSLFINKKRFGQNFLTDKNILKEIISHAEISQNDVVLEIGPGQGALTIELVNADCSYIHCVEIDTDLENWLRPIEKEFSSVLKIHFADALKFDYSALSPFPGKAVANIPYNITTPLISTLLKFAERGLRKHIYTVQLEAAERLTAKADTKERYPLGVTLEAMGNVKILRHVSSACFRPVPKVDSCVIEINLTHNFELGADKLWNKFLHEGFRQRRKMLVNNLKGFCYGNCNSDGVLKASHIIGALNETGLDPKIRAEDLHSEEWIKLYKLLAHKIG
jgi:16S rRNA (adenine1518-N6/adenine1519-N6)-dimethyltransferase